MDISDQKRLALVVLTLLGACSRDDAEHEPTTAGRGGAAHSGGVADMTSHDYSLGCSTAGCHAQLLETRWVHGPTRSGACSLCHPSERPLVEHTFLPALPEDRVCFQCHDDGAVATHVHEPYGSTNCLECHDPHGGASKNLIVTETASELCGGCHEEPAGPSLHVPFSEGDCLVCHEAHESEHAHLLQRTETELCSACHGEFREFLPETTADSGFGLAVHGAITDGGCRPCHEPHSGEHAPLLPATLRETCLTCHEGILDDFAASKTVHGAFEGEESCLQCHDPHGSRFESLLHDQENGLCFRCHDEVIVTQSGRKIPDMEARIESSEVLHAPVRQGDCMACHVAHFSSQRSLLRLEYPSGTYAEFSDAAYGLCFQCHDRALVEAETSTETWFRDGDRNLHHVHVFGEKGRACDVCHDPHGSPHHALLRDESPFGPGDWPMPLLYEQTERGGTCTTACHDPKGYDNSDDG